MTGRIAVLSRGLMRRATELGFMSGLEPRFTVLGRPGFEAVAGWGHKPTAARARALAVRSGLPYIAFEDGFLRSVRPGPSQPPISMVMDRTGIYYDARRPSDLEQLLEQGAFSAQECSEAEHVIAQIAAHGLSKYNHGAEADPLDDLDSAAPLVVVIDQTAGDESIAGGLATAADFTSMVEAAVRENPGATIIAKLHPETLEGAKRGHIHEAARRHGLRLLASHLSPWSLLRRNPKVYTVSSQFGFEALMAGCKVTCFGMPFYAGWGLTDDRKSVARRTTARSIPELAAAVYLRYSRYFDAWRRTPTDAMTAIDQLAFLRRAFLRNARPTVCTGIAIWKRRAVRAMLDGPNGPPRFVTSAPRAQDVARKGGAVLAGWGARSIAMRRELAAEGQSCLTIEDGFIRSAGLGAALVQPLSLVFDSRGIYYDPSSPSDIEHMLATLDISKVDEARAADLRQRIRNLQITKYNTRPSTAVLPEIPAGRTVILVPGQVSDDAAITHGGAPGLDPAENINAQLLARVRERNPHGFVIFKPHPDVEHMGRQGRLDPDSGTAYADFIARDASLEDLFARCDRVEVHSSLAGFEALVRGLSVTTHGIPFYAGWGLTEDLAPINRRGRRRSVDELVAIALIHYPRYWDIASGLPCPPEVAIERIVEYRAVPRGYSELVRATIGRAIIVGRRMKRLARRTGA